MRRLTLSNVAFWSLAAVCATMLVAMLLIIGGAIPIDAPQEPTQTESKEAAAAPAPTRSTAALPTPVKPKPLTPVAADKPVPALKPKPARVVVTAARGDSWISARLGSEEGRLLDERVLTQGSTVQLRGNRIWLSVGAAGHVDVTVNGEPRALAAGTVSVVLTSDDT